MDNTIEKIVPLRERVGLIVERLHPVKRGRYQYLEGSTGIKASSWQNIFRTGPKATQPSSDMLEALARTAPHFAFWLITGVADAESGHYDPRDPDAAPWRTGAE
ncbi:hypothetical protein ACMHYO_22635 [Allopusillimonas ginsengisoli]|uniref:hypothetical protein n=1 Tax=Allopusillimonas ginsengisoli TaxID=453575 RepID=UPI0039C0C251